MKKIISILFLIVNTLLFFNIREVYENKDLSDIAHIFEAGEKLNYVSVIINNNLGEMDSTRVFKMFKQLTSDYNGMITTFEFDDNRQEYFFYMMAAGDIDQRLGLVAEESLDFNNGEEKFFSNKKKYDSGVYFYLLNKGIEVSIYPFTYMETLRSGEYFFIADSQEEVNQMIEIFLDSFGSNVIEVVELQGAPLEVQMEIQPFLRIITIASMMITFLLVVMYIHTYSKKIAIFKTIGYPTIVTMRKIFLPFFMIITLTIILTNCVLFFLFIRAINERTIPIIGDLVQSGIYQIIGIFLIMVMSNFLMMLVPSYSLLKNSNINRHLMNTNYTMKIIILLLVLPPLTEKFGLIAKDCKTFGYALYDGGDGYQFVQGFKLEHSFGNDYLENLGTYYDEFTQNLNREIIYSYEPLYNHHQAYNILNGAGAILLQKLWTEKNVPTINVNENFLEKYPIKDAYGKWVDINEIKADVVHLVPDGVPYSLDPWLNSSELVRIDSQQSLFDYSLTWALWGMEDIPAYITVYKDSAFRLDATPFEDVFYEGDINELLKETVFHNKVEVSNMGDELSRIREMRFTSIVRNLLIIIPSLALIFVIIIQYAYLFMVVYQKQIFAKGIMGYSSYRIFGKLLGESIIAGIIAVIVAFSYGLDFQTFIIVIGMDIIVYIGVVFYTQWGSPLLLNNKEYT